MNTALEKWSSILLTDKLSFLLADNIIKIFMHLRFRAQFSCLILLWLTLITHSAQALSDRSQYGNSPYPIWSELSFFERDTLSKLDRAKNNDPEALLALGLVASGARDLIDYENVQRQIAAFSRRFKESNQLLLDEPWELGKALNTAMHNDFFLRADQSGAPSGYDEEQSRLMGIFETSEFNCISSALLYGVLAHTMGLDAVGVLLPSHAFIELSIPGIPKVEVETTSPGGFDQEHDEAFYEKANSSWFSARGLEPATYEDYLNRERLSLARLSARNMLNQHTREDQMARNDSARLAEISAYIDPNYLAAQQRRFYFYNEEIYTLITENQWETLDRFFDVTYSSVSLTAKAFKDNPSIQASYDHYLGGALIAHAQLAEVEPMLDLAGLLMERAEGDPSRTAKAETRIISAVSILLNQLARQAKFEEGVLVMTLIEGHIRKPANWPELSTWFYMRWADFKWGERDWQGVANVVEELLLVNKLNFEQEKKHLEMVESAFYNWSLEKLYEGDSATAIEIKDKCTAQFPHGETCDKVKKLLEDAEKNDWQV